MNIQEFKKIFPILRKHKIVPFLHGNQGIGKTQVVKQCAKEYDLQFIHLHLATQEVGDLVGLLIKNEDGTVKHARPEWFPTDGQGVIFLDELNRAHPEVLQAMFSFITEGTMHQHKLPSGWNIVAAGNYQNNEFTTTDMSDAAWLSRFCHIDFKPTTEEFILYAEDSEAFDIAGFIRENGDCLERKAKENNIDFITPDRRAWLTMIAPLDNEKSIDNERYELYIGCVGQSAAASYLTYKNKKEKAISGTQVLNQYEKVRETILLYSQNKNSRLDMITKTTNEILTRLKNNSETFKDEKQMCNLKEYLLDIPKESMLTFIDEVSKMSCVEKSLFLNDKEFSKRLKERAQLKDKK
jgi:hypothetical protein